MPLRLDGRNPALRRAKPFRHPLDRHRSAAVQAQPEGISAALRPELTHHIPARLAADALFVHGSFYTLPSQARKARLRHPWPLGRWRHRFGGNWKYAGRLPPVNGRARTPASGGKAYFGLPIKRQLRRGLRTFPRRPL